MSGTENQRLNAELAADGIEVLGPVTPEYAEILTPEALRFVADLERKFGARRVELLEARQQRQAEIDGGKMPDFLPETQHVRDGDWTIAGTPADLQDRRVEITGPVDRKMIINALNSGAKVFMADLEDSHAPTWDNGMAGHINLRDAVRRTITLETERKTYQLNDEIATLLVRPRGWHLVDRHVRVDGHAISGALLDFGLYFFHNAQATLDHGTGPYFYLAKLESHLEARLWNDVFVRAQEALGIPQGTIKVTVLIETILAAFEIDEILYELRDHIVGCNCGRWDYIFSYIKRFRNVHDVILPDRAQVTMTTHNMHSYSLLTIQTCHKRKAHAIGGMAAQIPIKGDPEANEAALSKVAADKEREAADGHDGTWVAHPGLVPIALEIFNKHMPQPNQVDRLREDVNVTAADLLQVPEGPITEEGLRLNVRVGIRYIEAWLRGVGCVPLYNLMEDAATAEISRTQVWQWVHHSRGILDDGRAITEMLFRTIMAEELDRIRSEVGEEAFTNGRFPLAKQLFEDSVLRGDFDEFLTLPAYEHILSLPAETPA